LTRSNPKGVHKRQEADTYPFVLICAGVEALTRQRLGWCTIDTGSTRKQTFRTVQGNGTLTRQLIGGCTKHRLMTRLLF